MFSGQSGRSDNGSVHGAEDAAVVEVDGVDRGAGEEDWDWGFPLEDCSLESKKFDVIVFDVLPHRKEFSVSEWRGIKYVKLNYRHKLLLRHRAKELIQVKPSC